MDWVSRPRVTDVTGPEYFTSWSFDATLLVCGDVIEFCANTVHSTEPYVPEFVLSVTMSLGILILVPHITCVKKRLV